MNGILVKRLIFKFVWGYQPPDMLLGKEKI